MSKTKLSLVQLHLLDVQQNLGKYTVKQLSEFMEKNPIYWVLVAKKCVDTDCPISIKLYNEILNAMRMYEKREDLHEYALKVIFPKIHISDEVIVNSLEFFEK